MIKEILIDRKIDFALDIRYNKSKSSEIWFNYYTSNKLFHLNFGLKN